MAVKYIVGVDAALRNVGIGVLDNTGKLVFKTNLTTPSGQQDHNSVDSLHDQFFEALEPFLTPELLKHKATVVYIEDSIFQGRGKGIARAEAIGVIKWMLRQYGVNIYGVPNQTLWSYICKLHPPVKKKMGSTEKKAWTIHWVHLAYNYWTDNDNIADGIALARFGYAHSIERAKVTVRALCRVR
jgi:Holliday junction resolvasome RuvABC endonuclease subunit